MQRFFGAGLNLRAHKGRAAGGAASAAYVHFCGRWIVWPVEGSVIVSGSWAPANLARPMQNEAGISFCSSFENRLGGNAAMMCVAGDRRCAVLTAGDRSLSALISMTEAAALGGRTRRARTFGRGRVRGRRDDLLRAPAAAATVQQAAPVVPAAHGAPSGGYRRALEAHRAVGPPGGPG